MSFKLNVVIGHDKLVHDVSSGQQVSLCLEELAKAVVPCNLVLQEVHQDKGHNL